MNKRPTPDTDAEVNELVTSNTYNMVTASFARRLERERDEAKEELGRIKMHVHSLVSNLESHPCACDWLDETISQLLQ